MANLVETDIPQDGGPEVDVPGLGLQGLERLSAQRLLSLRGIPERTDRTLASGPSRGAVGRCA